MAYALRLEIDCPDCGHRRILRPLDGALEPCEACGHHLNPVISEPLAQHGVLEGCVACGEHRLYRQKDFNRRAGLLVVVGGAAASLAVLPFSPLGAYAVLFGMAIVDALLYRRLPEVAICYRCKARHRGYDGSSRPEAFDLLTAELIDHQIRESENRRARS